MKKIFTIGLLFTTSFIFAQREVVVTNTRNNDNSVSFSYEKNSPGTYTLYMEFNTLDNASYSPTHHILTSAGGNLFTLKPIDKEKGISYSFNYKYIQGAYKPKGVDSSFVYLLPFSTNKPVQVFEHYNIGEVFLKQARPKGWKSYQLRSDVSDSIFAVRKGVVIKINDEFEYDTISSYTSKTNNIIIEHKDGSIVVYKGFKKGKIAVKAGDEVLPHDFLGMIESPSLKNRKHLSIMFYYLSRTGFEKNSNAEQTFFTPVFLTTNGTKKLSDKQKINVEISNEVITKEMTRKEKKEFEKK